MENIAVVGPGAIGIFLATRFAKTQLSVFLIDYRKERANKINKKGVSIIEENGDSGLFKIPCYTDVKGRDLATTVFLSVKNDDTERALVQAMKFLSPGGTLVSFQNGVQHIDLIKNYIPAEQTVFGTTCQGVTYVETGKVRHCGGGETLLVEEGQNSLRVSRTAEILNKAEIETRIVKDLPFLLWKKILFNVSINGLTAVLRIKNGKLPGIKGAWNIALSCFNEAREIAAHSVGPEIYQVTEDDLKEVCLKTYENTSSMLQDISRGKRTEIRALNGFIVQEGQRHNKKTPVNKLILRLVTALEEANR